MEPLLYGIIVVLVILLVGSLLYIFLYRRQISLLCDQLIFHREEESNKEIAVELGTVEVRALQKELNRLLKRMREREIHFRREEEKLQQTVTNISHDIRTPLTSVSGYFQLLEDTKNARERAHYTRIIRGRIGALGNILEEFFTYAKLGKEDMEEPVICDINQILCETLFLFYDEIKEKMEEPEIHIPQERIEVYGWEEQFRRIFFNIIKNALVHGKDKLRICMRQKEDGVEICFENKTGEELPEHPEDVFERFFKGDRARSAESSGLGLSIAKRLAEDMGGTIGAWGEDGWFGIQLRFPTGKRGRCNAGDTGNRRS